MQAPLLGIDFGERRVGIAITDAARRLALPLRTLDRSTDRRLAAELSALAAEYGAVGFVLGDPVLPDGSDTEMAARVRRFARRLARRSGRPVALIDEAHTTRAASRRLQDSRQPKGANEDAVAAQILLEDALSRTRNEGE